MTTLEARYVDWRQRYLRTSPMGYYCFYNGNGENGDAITCSEAHGYAMLIAVCHNNQQDFDQLLQFFLAFKNERGLMKWQVRQRAHSGEIYVEPDATDNATDGGRFAPVQCALLVVLLELTLGPLRSCRH